MALLFPNFYVKKNEEEERKAGWIYVQRINVANGAIVVRAVAFYAGAVIQGGGSISSDSAA